MTRRDFFKKIGAGILGFGLMCFFPIEEIGAATVTDNLTTGGLHVGEIPPSNRSLLWMDTSYTPAMPKYWTGVDWAACNSDMLDSHDHSYFAGKEDVDEAFDAISTIQTRITNEITAREEGEQSLQRLIDGEATDRWQEVSSLSTRLDNNNHTLSTSINNETNARTAADNALGGRIDSEVSARVAAITSEASARSNADTNLGNRIGNNVGNANAPVYVNGGNITAVSGLDASAFSTFKIPVNPSATANLNLWITT